MRRAKEDIADRGLEGVGVDVVVVVVEVKDVEIAAWRVRGSRRDTRPHVNAKHALQRRFPRFSHHKSHYSIALLLGYSRQDQ